MQNDILFDNIYIGHSVEDAEKLRSETFDIKHAIEKAEEDASKPPPPKDEPKGPLDINFMEDPVRFVREKLDLFWDVAKNDPVQAVKFFPDVAGGIGAVAVAILAILITAISLSSGASPPPQVKKAAEKAKQAATDAKDSAVDAATTATEKAQAELNKRTTRSSGPAE